SSSIDTLCQMIKAGMDVARVNLSHGNRSTHQTLIDGVREASKITGTTVGLLLDLPGPRIRVGRLRNGSVMLERGMKVTLSPRNFVGSRNVIPVDYADLASKVSSGDDISLANGLIRLKVDNVHNDNVICRVVVGGPLFSRKGVNIPSRSLKLPAITEVDKKHIRFGTELGADFFAVSFVRGPEDVTVAKELVRRHDSTAMVIAKIEKAEGFKRLKEILEVADGIMVARGDLGVELPIEMTPIIQKKIIQQCNIAGKPVITATQMLMSMVNSPVPTRAEVTDIANAVLDGTDAVMLSEETAVGNYPVQAVKVMAKIVKEAEGAIDHHGVISKHRKNLESNIGEAMSLSAVELALNIDAAAIVAPTRSGLTARRISRYRCPQPIVALTGDELVARQLLLSWGVIPIPCGTLKTTEEIFRKSEDIIRVVTLGKED
ncbi:pyruvate kinase, partial [Candidatus Woesearchaeota archaeon]|nr:pyruvate kinase [Candidatus Woesearchaeota archaeon]